MENLWTLKALLSGFQMAIGLKVDFFKSCLIGLNVSSDFISLVYNFMNFRDINLPFKYLGLPMETNPKRISTWEPFLQKLRRKLKLRGFQMAIRLKVDFFKSCLIGLR